MREYKKKFYELKAISHPNVNFEAKNKYIEDQIEQNFMYFSSDKGAQIDGYQALKNQLRSIEKYARMQENKRKL